MIPAPPPRSFVLGTSSLAVTNFLINDFGFTMPEASSNIPNPFCGFGPGTQSQCRTYGNTLYLGDGGSDDQNIPLLPILQPARQLDAIIAVDNSDDSGNAFDTDCGYNWPQAVSLQSTLSLLLEATREHRVGQYQGRVSTLDQGLPMQRRVDSAPNGQLRVRGLLRWAVLSVRYLPTSRHEAPRPQKATREQR
jgi:hypothetical protein